MWYIGFNKTFFNLNRYFLYNWPLVSTVCAFWFNLVVLATGMVTVLFLRNTNVDKMNVKEMTQESISKSTENSSETSKLSTNGREDFNKCLIIM